MKSPEKWGEQIWANCKKLKENCENAMAMASPASLCTPGGGKGNGKTSAKSKTQTTVAAGLRLASAIHIAELCIWVRSQNMCNIEGQCSAWALSHQPTACARQPAAKQQNGHGGPHCMSWPTSVHVECTPKARLSLLTFPQSAQGQ